MLVASASPLNTAWAGELPPAAPLVLSSTRNEEPLFQAAICKYGERRPRVLSAGYCRFCGLPTGSPAYSRMRSRLSRAGYLAAAGPAANARSTLAVT